MVRNAQGVPAGLVPCSRTADALLSALARTNTTADLAKLMDAISYELGFRHFALIHHDDLRNQPPDRVQIIKYPGAVVDRIIGQAAWRKDPVIRACNFSPHAFRWSDLPSLLEMDHHDLRCLELGANVGLDDGITVPFQLLGDCMGSCTFAGTRKACRAAKALGLAQMVGVFAFQAARRIIIAPARAPAPKPRLHPRPRDCVVLAGQGQSNKQIARSLSLTPRTVDGYLTEARELFGVHDRTELVLSALYAGEIGAHEIGPRQPE